VQFAFRQDAFAASDPVEPPPILLTPQMPSLLAQAVLGLQLLIKKQRK
jgi:hypothetical protein